MSIQNDFSGLFENGPICTYDKCPIILIDNSASTYGKILKDELIYTQSILKNRNITECYLMFWSDNILFHNGDNKTNIDMLHSIDMTSNGSTLLCYALDNIPDAWMKLSSDIYIVTDGCINDNVQTFNFLIVKLYAAHKHLYIITVENNNYNYMNCDISAGADIFNHINQLKLSYMIKQFICFNQFHNDASNPFVNYNNPNIGSNMTAFRDKVCRIDKTYEFVAYIESLIDIIKNNSDTIENKQNAYLKLSHDIVITLHYITKDKCYAAKRATIDMFCNLFVDVDMYKHIRALLLDEVNNIEQGGASTFTSYKNLREKVFERAQIALYSDTKKAITNIPQNNYISMIMSSNMGDIVIADVDQSIIHPLTINDRIYNNSCIQMGHYRVPMFPSKLTIDHNKYDQCVRQWLRINYAKKYNMNPASDMIMYCLFSDMVRVCLSDVPENVKQSYREMARLNMDRTRFGTNKSEFAYLMDNPPAPVKGNPNYIKSLLYHAILHSGFTNVNQVVDINTELGFNETEDVMIDITPPIEMISTTVLSSDATDNIIDNNIRPFTFWYAFIKLLGDDNLIRAQLPFCEEDMRINGVTQDNIIKFIQSKLKPIAYYERNSMQIEYNYTCYVTMEDTTNNGGYIVPAHRIGKNVVCSPRFVVSSEGYEQLKQNSIHINCPICHKVITDNFIPIPSYREYYAQINESTSAEPVICDPIYDIRTIDHVVITPDEYMKDEDQTIFPMNACNFNTIAYTIEAPYIQEAVNGRSIEVKTQEHFNNIVFNRYPFLKDLNMTGICLAGGFCRSILLKQRVKDLDFFMYGDNHNVNFSRALRDILGRLKAINPKYKFLLMYKHQFNVFEVVVVSDPNDFFQDDYKLDNYKQYKFKSLHQFDQFTIINPETGKIYRKKNRNKWEKPVVATPEQVKIENIDFSNYFEDGDINGIRMCYRLQFILTRNKNIENIFENFDMYPCRVAWDGHITWFTEKSIKAFKYMINIVNENNYSDLYNHRLGKYFSYGFNIVLPELDITKMVNQSNFKIEKLTFKINNINKFNIMVDHNSHIEDTLKSIEKLEKKSLVDGKKLYISSLFCSLVSLLRFIKINEVSYRFTNDVIGPNDDGFMEFREKTETVTFIDKIDSRIHNHDWYKEMRVECDLAKKTIDTPSIVIIENNQNYDLDQGL